MKTAHAFYILMLIILYPFSSLHSQDCNLREGSGTGDDYLNYGVDQRNDGVTISEFKLFSRKIQKVQIKYKFSNYLGTTPDWETSEAVSVYWQVQDIIPNQSKKIIIPWYDRNNDYYILLAYRVQCDNGVWTNWKEDPYHYWIEKGYKVGCTSNYWLDSKNVGSRSVTFNYRYGAKYTEVQLSEDGGHTWPISVKGGYYDDHITIDGLKSNTRYHHRHRIECHGGVWYPWAEFNADGADIEPFTTECAKPSTGELSTNNVNTGTGIEVTCLTAAAKYQYRLREKGTNTWNTSSEKTQNQHTFTNLQKFVEYEMQVRVFCTTNGSATDWSNSLLHTIPGTCPVPVIGDIGAKDIGTATTTLYCRSGHGDGIIDNHIFRWRKADGADWTTKKTSSNETNIKNLMDYTQYVMQVQHECTGSTTGNWSSMVFFTTEQKCKIEPTKITIQNISHETAELKCTVDRAGYLWKYRKAGGGSLMELPQQTSNRTTITGLKSGTTYEVALKVFCDPAFSDGFTEWVTFTTQVCETPEYNSIEAFDVQDHSAVLYYPYITNGRQFTWQYRQIGNTNWRTAESNGESTLVEDLVPGVTYEYRLRENCTETTKSAWSGIQFFFTTCDVNINRFTNVTSTSVKVKCQSGAEGFNFRYRMRNAANWTNIPTQINPEYTVTNLNPGTEYEFQVQGSCIGQTGTYSPSAYVTTRASGLVENENKILSSNFRSAVLCTAPAKNEIFAYDIGTSSVVLSCAIGQTDGYQFRIARVADTSWTFSSVRKEDSLFIPLLIPHKWYRYQVRIKCNNDFSEWSDTAFFITAPIIYNQNNKCFIPSLINLYPDQINSTSVRLNCREFAEKYQFRYRQIKDSSWVLTNEQTAKSLTISNLRPNMIYEFQCRLYCNNGWGNYSTSWIFSTQTQSGCQEPSATEFFAHQIQQTSARLISFNQANLYQYRYRLLEDKSWKYTDTVNIPFFELTELNSGKTYLYQSRLKCLNNTVSDFSLAKAFTTLPDCISPVNNLVRADSITSNSARIGLKDTTARYYLYRYKKTGDVDWKYIDATTDNAIRLEGLQKDTRYEFQIARDCNRIEFGTWSASSFFTTLGTTAIKNDQTLTILLYPNPASDYIRFHSNENLNDAKYIINTMTGAECLRGKISNQGSIPIESLPNGVFVIQFYSKKGMVYKSKLVVQK